MTTLALIGARAALGMAVDVARGAQTTLGAALSLADRLPGPLGPLERARDAPESGASPSRRGPPSVARRGDAALPHSG